jgi:hypothetical protein
MLNTFNITIIHIYMMSINNNIHPVLDLQSLNSGSIAYYHHPSTPRQPR